MRRMVMTVALMAAAISPQVVRADDQAIAQNIEERLLSAKSGGELRGFKIDLQVDQGTVWMKGHVANEDQLDLALDIARRVPGVRQVVNDLSIKGAATAPPSSAPGGSGREPLFGSRKSSAPAPFPAPEIGSGAKDLAERIPTADRGRSTQVKPAAHGTQSSAASDETIANTLVSRLQQLESRGQLTGCEIDLHVEERVVFLEGNCGSSEQQSAVIEIARRISGVKQVVNGIRVSQAIRQTSAMSPTAAARPIQAVSGSPVPVGYRPIGPVAYQQAAGAAPVPTQMPSNIGGVQGVSYDHPNLPGYAWPATAAYPNYGALTYPRQYSPSAWPYIGPFYPYPQVPLGWRKVALEWDDGWWFLDFTSR